MRDPYLKKTFEKALTIILFSAMACGGFLNCKSVMAATGKLSESIIDKFEKPDVDARPMARMWFPDAGAGADKEGLALVSKQINDMAAGGFGGVEIAFLSDSTSYTNDDARTIGWGTENWRKVLKEALKASNAVKDGFKIDITITAHWPPVVNNIDPNDDEASQEMTVAYRKISEDDLASGIIDLPLPTQRTRDYNTGSVDGVKSMAAFFFVEKYVAATIARVAGFNEKGMPVFEISSLTDVSKNTTKKTVSDKSAAEGAAYREIKGVRYAGYAGGVPDREYATAKGLDYEKDVVALLGPEPEKEDFEGKIDSEGSRKRMADWQYIYETGLNNIDVLKGYNPSKGEKISEGDYVLIGTYHRGTGQVMSGGNSITIYNRSYATDYFNEKGVGKVFEFWKKNILDAEMLKLLKENGRKNGSSIFEDSIEIFADEPIWTSDLLKEFKAYNGYDAVKYAPVLAFQPSGPPNVRGNKAKPTFDDQEGADRIIEDYNLLLGHLYATKHAAVISKWASGFNYTYRAQGYELAGLDIAGAAAALDIPEGDNASSGDGIRNLAAAVNVKGDKMLSMESTTFSANINSTWQTVVKELNRDFSHGVNRSILHGSAFAKAFNDYGSKWPGWNFWDFFSSWNSRQIYWSDVDTFSNYVSRSQALMQNGKARVDIAVLQGTESSFEMPSGNSMQTLLDRGYSYNLLSESLLRLDSAKVKNGMLCASGPAYRAVIIKEAKILSSNTIKILLEYSRNGLPIILFNCDMERIFGTNRTGDNDSLLKERVAQLLSAAGVRTAETQDEILGILQDMGVEPAASYNAAGLETSHRTASEGDYYYFFNNSDSGIETEVALKGKGNPYSLDAWTGDITPIADYRCEDDRIHVKVKLNPKEAAIIAISGDTANFPRVKEIHAINTDFGDILYDKENMVHRADKAGNGKVLFSDSTEKTVTVKNVPAAINLVDGWALKIESWGPDTEANLIDPTISDKKTISFKDIGLAVWKDLPATEEQLKKVGLDTMDNVSGIGWYSRAFTLPSDWGGDTGAYMHFDHDSDMVVEVIINDNRIDDINQLTNTVDVGRYLKKGSNTLEIKLDTTLKNRMNLEKPGSGFPGGGGGGGGMGGSGGGAPEGAAPEGFEGMQGQAGGAPGAGMGQGGSGAGQGSFGTEGAPSGLEGMQGQAGGAPGAGMGQGGSGAGRGASGQSDTQKYGLTGVTLLPYVQTVLIP